MDTFNRDSFERVRKERGLKTAVFVCFLNNPDLIRMNELSLGLNQLIEALGYDTQDEVFYLFILDLIRERTATPEEWQELGTGYWMGIA